MRRRRSGGRSDRASRRARRARAGPSAASRESVSAPGYTQTLAMPLAVDSFVLGPFQSNCYVVRSERGAPEAAVVDPGDDPTALRLELARMGTRTAAGSSSRTPTSTTSAASRRSPTAPAPRSGRRPARSRRCARATPRGGFPVAAARPGAHRRGRRRDHRRRHRLRGASTSRATRSGHVAFHARRRALRRRPPLRRLGRPRTTSTGGDWETLLASIRSLLERFPPETIVYPGHGPATTLGRELADESVSARAARTAGVSAKFQAPRGTHDVLPARRQLVARRPHDGGGDRALRLGPHPDARLRGHRPLRAHVGRGLRRRAQGDVHVHRPQRPLADAAPGGHRADRARLPRARPAPRAAAGEGVHDRADVPLRRAGHAAATASTTSCPSRRSARPTRRSTPRSSSSTTSSCAGSA